MAQNEKATKMFAIQIHTIETVGKGPREKRNIFLDISSEGGHPRRYLMGNFAKDDRASFESVVHYTNTAVTLSLDCGPLRYHLLGVSTIFKFLQPDRDEEKYNSDKGLPTYEYLTFGRSGSEPSFQVCYSVREVTSYYQFVLNELTCLKQVTSWRYDQMWAEIEFNHSVHSIDRGPYNRYRLGPFNTHDIAGIHTGFNLTFSSVSNFVITFYAKSLLSENVLGVLKFVPLQEVFYNQQNQRHDLDDSDPAAPIDWITSLRGGLRMIHVDSISNDKIEVTLADFTKSTTTRKRLHSEAGGYEILFTITKNARLKQEILPKTLWKRLDSSEDEKNAVQILIADPESIDRSVDQKEVLPSQNINQKELIHGNEAIHKLIQETTQAKKGQIFKTSDFGKHSSGNYVEVLIDGLQTFRRYYEVLTEARHSIAILGWEISLSFGLILEQLAGAESSAENSNTGQSTRRWITLEDVLISKAKEGVKVRIVVWRHELLSHLNRYLYLGDVTVENEMAKLEKRCKKNGVSVKILHTTRSMPTESSPYAHPYGKNFEGFNWDSTAASSSSSNKSNFATNPTNSTSPIAPDDETDIVVIISGNPKGLISSHHEKLVLIDAECPEHTFAFTGGFDIARGRYDQPSHRVPLPGNKRLRDAISKSDSLGPGKEERYTGRSIQPVLRQIRFLWHDLQLLIKGPATRSLHLHFVQRWYHAFSPNPNKTRSIILPAVVPRPCQLHNPFTQTSPHQNCILRLERTWKTVFDVHYLFEDYCKMIKSAQKFLYIEHQYPFQNFTLTQLMCEQLKSKPNLRLIVVTPIKTDLPTGIVGEIVDWSQDHIIQHLHLIQSVAPDRVGIYGLVNQDKRFPEKIGGIYVHSKLTLIDDLWMVTGSTNMDNISFFHSSELSIEIYSPQIAREVRIRLFSEHLGRHYVAELDDDLEACFNVFRDAAELNRKSLRETGLLQARPISLVPMESYNFILSKVYYPNKFTKLLMKLGLSGEDVIQVVGDGVDNVFNFVVQKAKL